MVYGASLLLANIILSQWKEINRKQSTRWQHLSQLKARAFFSLQKYFSCYETQQLILGTGTAIWWVTEPHCKVQALLLIVVYVAYKPIPTCAVQTL
jgi:hypothetical protein